MQYILASASPRRQELIKLITEDFSVIPADIDETLPDNINPFYGPEFLAVKKAEHISKQHKGALVIGADTGVFLENRVLGKPKSEDDAKEMLKSLSGKTHKVITGCAIFYNGKHLSFSEETSVEFYPLSDNEIIRYISTGEPMDKAGAYGIQAKGSLFIKGIQGDYFNVVGLPIARLKRELENFFKIFGEN